AIAMLRSAGLTYDPQRAWADHFVELAARGRDRTRYSLLIEQLIPQAEAQSRPAAEIEDLRSQLALIEAQRAGGAPASVPAARDEAARSPIEIEHERERQEAARERIEKRRGELRLQIDEISRRYHAQHPEKQVQKERL